MASVISVAFILGDASYHVNKTDAEILVFVQYAPDDHVINWQRGDQGDPSASTRRCPATG